MWEAWDEDSYARDDSIIYIDYQIAYMLRSPFY